jgi:hypothetical protein
MNPILKQEEVRHHIVPGQIFKFISDNSEISLSDARDYAYKNGILTNSSDYTYYNKDILYHPEEYNEHQVKWIGGFFQAHPWISEIIIISL